MLVTGLAVLPPAAVDRLVQHLGDESAYARATKASLASTTKASAAVDAATNGDAAAAAVGNDETAPRQQAVGAAGPPGEVRAVVPASTSLAAAVNPAVEGLPPPNGQLAAERIVLTGVFEMTSSKTAGLERGKDRVRELVMSYGATVTTSVSKKTTILLCGDEVGASRVAQATKLGTQILDLAGLKALLQGEEATPVSINTFSTGEPRSP